ncbi:hypothetical protein ZHAS_00014198 [Anopheles sinensis]|uniref:Uncharacterized protein n=1 Tax=Anopheles sinensis TaxID=74873 RepID=A0A084W7K1_ANOSI|nr:hypothetical protein ZHAS_00014198 [Anopheles sinensis]
MQYASLANGRTQTSLTDTTNSGQLMHSPSPLSADSFRPSSSYEALRAVVSERICMAHSI